MSAQPPELMRSAEALSTNKLLNIQLDPSKLWMGRLYISPYCRVFYALLLVVNLACVIWTLVEFGEFPKEPWFIALVVLLAVLVCVEVIWRMCLQGLRGFVKAGWNLCDMAAGAGGLVALGCATLQGSVIAGLAGEAVLIFRTVFQYLRLVYFIRDQHKAQNALQMLNFCELAQPKAEAPSHVLAEEEDRPNGIVPNNTGTAQDASEESRQPRTLMIPNRT